MKLTDTQKFTIANALHTAAERYSENAQDMQEAARQARLPNSGKNPVAFDRLATQFVKQADEARALAEKFW